MNTIPFSQTVGRCTKPIPLLFRIPVPISYMGIPDVKIQSEVTNTISVYDVIHLVTDHTKINLDVILTKTRKREVVVARQIIFYFLRKYSNLSTTAIGKQFNKDHATVLHANKTINNLKDSDKKFATNIQLIEDKIIAIINSK